MKLRSKDVWSLAAALALVLGSMAGCEGDAPLADGGPAMVEGVGTAHDADPNALIRGLEWLDPAETFPAGSVQRFRVLLAEEGDLKLRVSSEHGFVHSVGDRITWTLPLVGERAELSVDVTRPGDGATASATYAFQLDAPTEVPVLSGGGGDGQGTHGGYEIVPLPIVSDAATGQVDDTPDSKSACDLSIGAGDVPHVAWRNGTHPGLYYATFDSASGEWQVEVVDGMGFDIGEPVDPTVSMVLDSSSRPHIAYRYSSGEIRYAHKSGGSWILESVAPVDELIVDDALTIALDPANGQRPTIMWTGVRDQKASQVVWDFEDGGPAGLDLPEGWSVGPVVDGPFSATSGVNAARFHPGDFTTTYAVFPEVPLQGYESVEMRMQLYYDSGSTSSAYDGYVSYVLNGGTVSTWWPTEESDLPYVTSNDWFGNQGGWHEVIFDIDMDSFETLAFRFVQDANTLTNIYIDDVVFTPTGGRDHLPMLAYRTGANSWSTVESPYGDFGDDRRFNGGFDFASNGVATYTYDTDQDGELKVGTWSASGGFGAQGTAYESGGASLTAVAHDSAGKPVVAHQYGVEHLIGAAWNHSDIETGDLTYPDMVWNGDRPVIALVHGSDLEIVTPNDRGYWVYTEAQSSIDSDYVGVDVDSAGVPHACYRDGSQIWFW